MMHTKTLFFFGLLLLVALAYTACTKGDEALPLFPATYRYDGFEFRPSRFFVLTASGQNEIAASGTFKNFDALLQQEFDFANLVVDGFPTQKIEVLDNTKVRISGTQEGTGSAPYTFDGTYTRTDNRLVLNLDQFSVEYALESDAAKAFWDISMSLVTYKKDGKTEYGSLDIAPATSAANINEMIAGLRLSEKLTANDTVVLNFSRYRYVRE